MANQELDNILEHEYETITRNRTPSKAPGLLDMIRLPAEAPTIDESIQTRAPSLKPILAQSSAPSPINQGYTPPAVPSTPNNKTESSIAGTIGTTALKLFTSGLGVMPLISGLAGIFGGGEPASPPALVKYAMPRSIQISAANSKDGGTLSFADHDQGGAARAFGPTSNSVLAQTPVGSQTPGNSSNSQVVVNVQAMDSRSFLDHSQEIAQAVREAMLNMHALNDVVSEL